MIKAGQIKSYLEEMARKAPTLIYPSLKKGGLVAVFIYPNSGVSREFYEIDDPEIHLELPGSQEDLPYEICRRFDSFWDDGKGDEFIRGLFRKHGENRNGISVLPFSVVVSKGFGECLEKAVLYQLTMQSSMPVFLVQGYVYEKGEKPQPHAFNVAFKGNPELCDMERPFWLGESSSSPFSAPIMGVDEWHGGRIIFPKKWADGRQYQIKWPGMKSL